MAIAAFVCSNNGGDVGGGADGGDNGGGADGGGYGGGDGGGDMIPITPLPIGYVDSHQFRKNRTHRSSTFLRWVKADVC